MNEQSRRAFSWRPDRCGPPLDPPENVLDLIDEQFTTSRGRPALIEGPTSLTYEELDLLCAAVARALRIQGVKPGDAVVIRSRLSRWAIIAMLGVLRAGARYAAIDAVFPIERQRRFRAASGAWLEILEPGLSAIDETSASVDLATLVAVGLDAEDDAVVGRQSPKAGAYTQFTSGSTGDPKAVTVSVGSLAYSTAARLTYYDAPMKGFLLCSSISFDMSVATIYWTLAAGGTLIIPADRPSDIVAVAEAAQANAATHLLMLPSLYQLLLAADLRGQLASLNTVIVAGEVCPPRLVQEHFAALPGSRMFNEYGPTECAVWSTVHECRPADAVREIVPIGTPIPGAAVYVRGVGDPHTNPDHGELWIGGPGVAETLSEEPGEVPRLAVAGRPVYRTGDLVSWSSDGLLEFRGRADNQLKVGGLRIEIGELEQAILTHQDVQAVGVGVADRGSAKPFLVAFVVTDGGMDMHTLRTHLLPRLPSVAIPAAVVSVEVLPTQPNDKLDRRALDSRAELLRIQRSTDRSAARAVR